MNDFVKKLLVIFLVTSVLVSGFSTESKAEGKQTTKLLKTSAETETGSVEEPKENLLPPVLESVITQAEGMYVKFSKVDQADAYRIYIRKAGSTDAFEEIANLKASEYDLEMSKGGVFLAVKNGNIELGKSYEIMVRSVQEKLETVQSGFWYYSKYVSDLSADSNILRADMPQDKVSHVKVSLVSQSETKIEWDKSAGVKGYEIQFSTTENGVYQKVPGDADESSGG